VNTTTGMLADSSVWIDLLKGRSTSQVVALDDGLKAGTVDMADLVAMEVLRGLREDRGSRIRSRLLKLEMHEIGGIEICLLAAGNYRALRARGITVRSTIDCLIATYCIQGGHTLLHSDRDFDPFEQHLGLRVFRTGPASR
jgi:predicted nucleic acid-binding protein